MFCKKGVCQIQFHHCKQVSFVSEKCRLATLRPHVALLYFGLRRRQRLVDTFRAF